MGAIFLLVILGLFALGAAMLPHRILVRIEPPDRVAQVRVGVAAAGLAILPGIGLALVVG